MDQRIQNGHFVEGHGDLRPEHVCLTHPIEIIDCLEFDRNLRLHDPVGKAAPFLIERREFRESHSDTPGRPPVLR
jgi:aminoglycoside phosphotransferase family enzyme